MNFAVFVSNFDGEFVPVRNPNKKTRTRRGTVTERQGFDLTRVHINVKRVKIHITLYNTIPNIPIAKKSSASCNELITQEKAQDREGGQEATQTANTPTHTRLPRSTFSVPVSPFQGNEWHQDELVLDESTTWLTGQRHRSRCIPDSYAHGQRRGGWTLYSRTSQVPRASQSLCEDWRFQFFHQFQLSFHQFKRCFECNRSVLLVGTFLELVASQGFRSPLRGQSALIFSSCWYLNYVNIITKMLTGGKKEPT